MSGVPAILAKITRKSDQVRKAQERTAALEREREALMLEAARAGVPQVEIADAAGLSKQRVQQVENRHSIRRRHATGTV